MLALALLILQEGLPWTDDLGAALESSKRDGKPVFVFYHAVWCAPCKRFQAEALSDPSIQELADRYLWVKVDIDREVSTARERGVEWTPAVDVIGQDGRTRLHLRGAVSAAELLRGLDRAAEEPHVDLRARDGTMLVPTPQGYRGSGTCYENAGYGPLRLPSLSPFQSLRYGLQPRTPSTLAQGVWEFHASASWANLWALNEGDHLVDYEIQQTVLSIAVGLTDVVQLELAFTDRSRFGGELDGFIQGFHDVFGIDQGGRDEVPRGELTLEIERPDGGTSTLDESDRGPYSDALTLTILHNLTCGDQVWPAIAYSATVRVELNDSGDFDSANLFDLAGSISVSKRWGDFFFYLGLGYSWYGSETFLGIALENTQLSGLFCVEWQLGDGVSLIAQYLLTQGVAEGLNEFSEPSNEITFGTKIELTRHSVLELGLLENVLISDNSPDFGLHVAVYVRF